MEKVTKSQYNNKYVLVFGATNSVDMLDGALLRPGRFDYILLIDNCHEETALEVLTATCRKTPLSPDIDLQVLNKRILKALQDSGLGANGANVANSVSEAANHAMKRIISYKLASSTVKDEKENEPVEQTDSQFKALQRYKLQDYFDTNDENVLSQVVVTMEDFEAYLQPLEVLAQNKNKAQSS